MIVLIFYMCVEHCVWLYSERFTNINLLNLRTLWGWQYRCPLSTDGETVAALKWQSGIGTHTAWVHATKPLCCVLLSTCQTLHCALYVWLSDLTPATLWGRHQSPHFLRSPGYTGGHRALGCLAPRVSVLHQGSHMQNKDRPSTNNKRECVLREKENMKKTFQNGVEIYTPWG